MRPLGMYMGQRNAQSPNLLHFPAGVDVRASFPMVSGDFTACIWAKYLGSDKGGGTNLSMFGWEEGPWGGTRVGAWNTYLSYRWASGSSSTAHTITTSKGGCTDNEWHHYAIRKNGNNYSLTLDCEVFDSRSTTLSHKNDKVPMSIGGHGDDMNIHPTNRGVKSMGMFCYFGRSLSDDELRKVALSNRITTSGVFDGLLCGYELSDRSGLEDVTGNYPLERFSYYGDTEMTYEPLDISNVK